MQRKYSLDEIDAMRLALCDIEAYSDYLKNQGHHPDKGAERAEQRLRTYMLNGTEPEELVMRAEELRRLELTKNIQRQKWWSTLSPEEQAKHIEKLFGNVTYAGKSPP